MLNFPVAYCLLRFGFQPESTIIAATVIAVFCLALRLFMLHKMVNLQALQFLRRVVLNFLVIAVLASLIPLFVIVTYPESFIRLLVSLGLCVFCVCLSVWYMGCTKEEREYINKGIKKIKYTIMK